MLPVVVFLADTDGWSHHAVTGVEITFWKGGLYFISENSNQA